jgi:hypothetical protein
MMATLSDFFDSKRINHGRGIQKALRRIDTHILALSLVGVDEDRRRIIYRNMTERAERLLEEEIGIVSFNLENNDAGTDEVSVAEAAAMVAEELFRWTNEKLDQPVACPEELPEVKLDCFENILQTFVAINDHARKYGLFSINGIENKSGHPLFKKGMEFVLDGIDPLVLEEIMENYIASLSARYARELNMIRTGIRILQLGYPSFAIVENLKSLENS